MNRSDRPENEMLSIGINVSKGETEIFPIKTSGQEVEKKENQVIFRYLNPLQGKVNMYVE